MTSPEQPLRHWCDLLLLLTLREFRRRYLTIAAGISFTLLVSLASLLALSVVFGGVFRDRVHVPYPLFVFCALIPWTFLQNTASHAVDAFRANANIVRKVSFPRVLLPLSVVAVNAVVMASALVALVPFLLYRGFLPSWHWLWLLVALAAVISLGAGLAMLLSTLSVYYVEIRPLTDVVLMLWFYATPVFYPESIVPARFAWISGANPMTHIVDIARSALVDPSTPSPRSIAIGLGASLVLFAAGLAFVTRHSPTLADDVT